MTVPNTMKQATAMRPLGSSGISGRPRLVVVGLHDGVEDQHTATVRAFRWWRVEWAGFVVADRQTALDAREAHDIRA